MMRPKIYVKILRYSTAAGLDLWSKPAYLFTISSILANAYICLPVYEVKWVHLLNCYIKVLPRPRPSDMSYLLLRAFEWETLSQGALKITKSQIQKLPRMPIFLSKFRKSKV